MERNRLTNGRFRNNLDGWTASGAVYSAGDGDDHYGVAVFGAGDYLVQTFAVTQSQSFTLHASIKSVGGDLEANDFQAVITDGDGNAVVSLSLEGTSNTWVDNTDTVGLVPGTQYTLKLINNSFGDDVKVDDVWIWFVPITRANIAARVHAKLGRLATDRSYSTAASGSLTEGDYTYAIDAGLRSVSAINAQTGQPDTRYSNADDVNSVINVVYREMVEQLQAEYAVESDITVGPRTERRSQIAGSLSQIMETGAKQDGSGGIVMKRMRYDD
jgi:hypothetical protein